MNIQDSARLAVKYVLRYRRRYLFLFCALAFGFCVISVVSALKEGIAENLYLAGQSHYAGDIVFLGEDSESEVRRHLDAEAKAAVYEAIAEAAVPVTRSVERTLYNDDATLFFNGEALSLRYLNGVDWEKERPYFDKLSYAAGKENAPDEDSIIISEQAAAVLRIEAGDSLTLELLDRNGQKSTGSFIVAAVIQDKTLFGLYKAYVSRKVMNTLVGFDRDDASSVGVFLKDRRSARRDMLRFQRLLAEKTQAAPPIMNARDWSDFKPKNGIAVFVLTLSVYLQPLNELVEAINALNYLLYAMLLLIILASAGVTYRLILNERIKEMGVMRAIGFYESGLRRILVMEAALLGALAAAAGFLLAFALSQALQLVPLSKFPSFEILLSNGSLRAIFSPLAVLTNIVALYLTLFFAVSVPACRVSKMALPQMLTGSAKG